MKFKLLLLFIFASSQLLHSQTEKKLKGSVVSDNVPLQGIEVANLKSKQTTITNNSGVFSIMAKAGDKIILISKNYEYQTVTLAEEDFKTNLVIKLTKKIEELEEVIVTNTVKAPKVENMQKLLDTLYADDKYSKRKDPLLNDGTITNGTDVIKVLGKVAKLFTKQKDSKTTEIPKVEFKKLAENNFSQDFFGTYLKLNPDEISLFLEYCAADSKSQKFTENSNELEIMEFLLAKNTEFKKIQNE